MMNDSLEFLPIHTSLQPQAPLGFLVKVLWVKKEDFGIWGGRKLY